MALLDLVEKQAKAYGWLSVSVMYFDNAYVLSVFNCKGNVAVSKDLELIFAINTLDSTDTENVEHSKVRMPYGYIGTQQNITVSRFEDLQHVDFALYSHNRFYNTEDPAYPIPRYPTPTVLDGYELNPETGLYKNCDVMIMANNDEVPSVPIYDSINAPTITNPYVGADITEWRNFNKNQEKFKTMIKTMFGAIDVF